MSALGAIRRGLVTAALWVACGCAASSRPELSLPRPVKDVSPLEKQLAASPDDPNVNLELGDRAASGGDWLRAEQYYQRAEALGVPAAQLVPRLLNVLVLARRYGEALERCRRRLSQTPTDRGTRLVEAAILTALERPHDAERELNLLLRTKPDDPNPYLALGKLYRDSYNDAGRARALFARYLELAPKGEEADAIRYQLDEAAAPPESAPPMAPAGAAP